MNDTHAIRVSVENYHEKHYDTAVMLSSFVLFLSIEQLQRSV